MKGLSILEAVAFASLLSGCATNDAPGLGDILLAETARQNGHACIELNTIINYSMLRDDIISIESHANHYLVTLMPECKGIQPSAYIPFGGTYGKICGQALDQIKGERKRCTINRIFEFDDRDDALDAYHAALKKQRNQK
jgi:hypothetical protein